MRTREITAAALFSALCCLGPLLFGGCAYFLPEIPVTICLPEEPHPWEAAGAELSYCLEYLDAAGELQCRRIAPGRRAALLRISRRLCSPVMARPAGRLVPAGGFLSAADSPAELIGAERELRLSWREGAAARLLLELAAAGAVPDVDGPLLSGRMCEEGEGDPHRCVTGGLRSALGYGLFSGRHVDAQPLVTEVTLPLEGDGWIPGNPLFQGTVSFGETNGEDGGAVTISGIYPGVHAFYRPAAGTAALAEVDAEGRVRVLLEPLRDFTR
jgi:hypothetical protein